MSQFILQPFIDIQNIMSGFFALAGLSLTLSSGLIKRSPYVSTATQLVIKRWLRYVLSTIVAISINMMWITFASGPLFSELSSYTLTNCHNSWWRTLLMINNFDDTRRTCLAQTWFLSVNFQLYILALISFLLIMRSKKLGMAFCSLFILMGMFIPTIKHFRYGYLPTIIGDKFE